MRPKWTRRQTMAGAQRAKIRRLRVLLRRTGATERRQMRLAARQDPTLHASQASRTASRRSTRGQRALGAQRQANARGQRGPRRRSGRRSRRVDGARLPQRQPQLMTSGARLARRSPATPRVQESRATTGRQARAQQMPSARQHSHKERPNSRWQRRQRAASWPTLCWPCGRRRKRAAHILAHEAFAAALSRSAEADESHVAASRETVKDLVASREYRLWRQLEAARTSVVLRSWPGSHAEAKLLAAMGLVAASGASRGALAAPRCPLTARRPPFAVDGCRQPDAARGPGRCGGRAAVARVTVGRRRGSGQRRRGWPRAVRAAGARLRRGHARSLARVPRIQLRGDSPTCTGEWRAARRLRIAAAAARDIPARADAGGDPHRRPGAGSVAHDGQRVVLAVVVERREPAALPPQQPVVALPGRARERTPRRPSPSRTTPRATTSCCRPRSRPGPPMSRASSCRQPARLPRSRATRSARTRWRSLRGLQRPPPRRLGRANGRAATGRVPAQPPWPASPRSRSSWRRSRHRRLPSLPPSPRFPWRLRLWLLSPAQEEQIPTAAPRRKRLWRACRASTSCCRERSSSRRSPRRTTAAGCEGGALPPSSACHRARALGSVYPRGAEDVRGEGVAVGHFVDHLLRRLAAPWPALVSTRTSSGLVCSSRDPRTCWCRVRRAAGDT